MKRIIAIILCFLLTLTLLTSCGKLSEENIDCAESVLEATDFYLEGKIASGTAVSALELFKNSVKNDGRKSAELITLITDISNAMLTAIETSETDDLLLSRNTLAKYIGAPEK